MPDERPCIINRAGYAGISSTSHHHGHRALRLRQHGLDIGGFDGPAPEAELLVRWIQNGIFQPRFCMNLANNDNTVDVRGVPS